MIELQLVSRMAGRVLKGKAVCMVFLVNCVRGEA